ncbi:adenylate cyclase type 3-like, partial [Uranotaenia lowii]|uniref:adenylate cyclase type 3-like n=1 Tax=Uranotaenia lowii TaxID=190385 RepID=UPI0024797FB4
MSVTTGKDGQVRRARVQTAKGVQDRPAIKLAVLDVKAKDSLGWAVVLNFLVYVTLPVLLKYTGILLGLGSFATYVNAIIGLAKKENFFWEQQIANILLLLAATGIGLLYYFLAEFKQRRAFLEAKQGLEVKMLIEEQSAEQVSPMIAFFDG